MEGGLESIAQIKDLFNAADTNNTGHLDIQEFTELLRRNSPSIDEEAIFHLFMALDRNGNGFIDFNEFVESIKGEVTNRRLQAVRNAWESLDK